jgi:hypothetical protein
MGEHSLLSPSAASRWMNCTASVRYTQGMPDKTSKWADEGTAAHEHAAWGLKLLTITDPEEVGRHMINMPLTPFDCEDMKTYVGHYISHVAPIMQKADAYGIEENFAIDIIEGFGTIDFWAIKENQLSIVDLKYGQGIKVSAIDNSQLKLYAYGVLDTLGLIYDIEDITVSIVQPRCGKTGNYSTWGIKAKALYDWANYTVKVKAEMALAGKGLFREGPWCWFCKGKSDCKEIKMKQAISDFRF